MLSLYVSNYQAQLLTISDAQLCPFTSVGHLKTLKKRLLEQCWLNAKNNKLNQTFTAPDLNLLITFQQNENTPDVIAQACIEVMANLPQNINITFINNILNEPQLQQVAKLIISKVLLQQHSYNLIALIDLNTLFFAYTNQTDYSDEVLALIKHILVVATDSTPSNLIKVFNNLCENGLVNSPLMSLFLLSLSSEQVNTVSNHASNTLSIDHTLQVLLQSGFVKLVPLANTALHKVEQPKKIIALIKRILGDKLDLLVNYETQIQAWNEDEQGYTDFQQQLQLNWPKQEAKLSSLRLMAGYALNEQLNAIQMTAMDSYSQAVFNLYKYYQYIAAKKANTEALV
ncbi:hypothetical protein [Pseudoalteromonas sp. Z9A5]|uniref:hypothetical protein n=1 Tax=Pseudoalteromonas sp. Z9A5 TaxID=2686355 RepID=UPI00140AB0C0|nr:hypothetical protein [Pseudoalteromonas sp. Z9A5]